MDQKHIEKILSQMEFEMKVAIKPEQIDRLVNLLQSQQDSIIHRYCQALTKESPALKTWIEQALNNFTPSFGHINLQTLTNEYFDTPQDTLFNEYAAGLRLRRSSQFKGVEQTIKLKGSEEGATHSHLEFNVRTEQDLQVPDLKLFDAESLPPALTSNEIQSQLQGKYKTDFTRTTAELSLPLIGKVELALDQGTICAQGGLCTKICETELELKKADPSFFKLPCLEHALAPNGAPNGAGDAGDAGCGCPESNANAALSNVENVSAPVLEALQFEPFDLDDIKLMLVHNTLEFVKQLNHSIVQEEHMDAVFGLEPFSKLKRAVLLKMQSDIDTFRNTHPDQELPASLAKAAKDVRVNFEYRKLLKLLSQKGEYNPSIIDYVSCGEMMMLTFFDACGKVKLFGTMQSLQDLRDVLQDCSDFARDSWFYKDAAANAWDDSWGLCSIFKRQSFWGGLAKRFMTLVEEFSFEVSSLLEEQKAPESNYGKGTQPFSELFYSAFDNVSLELPLLVHLTSYCSKRYRLLLNTEPDCEAFEKILNATATQLAYILPGHLAKTLLSSPCDTDDMQRLFEHFGSY